MNYRSAPSVRACAILLLLACLWTLCGAPIDAAQWQSIPMNLRRLTRQVPGRMRQIFLLWHGGTLLSEAKAETRLVELTLQVWDSEAQAVRSLPLEDYVAGVVACEMPARYHLEALKCQAVAARTRAIASCRRLGGNGCATHRECDVCTDASCCQGYLGLAARKARWSGESDAMEARVWSAVRATAGQILTYEGLPIQVLYHACSGGRTEDAAAVFAQAAPYLTSVESPGEESSSAYAGETVYSRAEAAKMLEAAFPGCGVTAESLPGQLRLQASTASGRVASILVGTETVTGRAFREALSLRSASFTWDADDESITFHTRGYGHGVGMSQVGAQAMAASGAAYGTILTHYYQGVRLSLLPELHEDAASGSQ